MAHRARGADTFLAVGLGLCLTLGCVRATQAPVAAPMALATAAPAADAPPRTVLDERFQRTWPNDPQGTAWFGGGAYTLFARQPGQFVAIRAPLAEVPSDVEVSGTFHKVGGPPGGGYGLIVRDQAVGAGDGVDQNGQFLVAAAGDLGQVGIWQRADAHWIDVLPWTASPLVHPGAATNELKVEVVGSRLRFDVNGEHVADVEVGFPAGSVGLFVGGDGNQVQLDRLLVEAPTASASASANGERTAAGQPPTPAPDISAAQTRLTALADEASRDSNVMQDGAWRQEMAATLALVEQIERGASDSSSSAPSAPDTQRLRTLMGGITDNLASILDAFASGIDSQRNPLTNKQALNRAAADLDSATRQANEVLAEVQAARSAAQGASTTR